MDSLELQEFERKSEFLINLKIKPFNKLKNPVLNTLYNNLKKDYSKKLIASDSKFSNK